MQIPLSKFEQYVDESILKRGLSYFRNGYVHPPEEISPGIFETTVLGKEDYIVIIEIKNGKIKDYDCNCPYDGGPVCKHVVAVLYRMTQDDTDGTESQKAKSGKVKKGKSAIEKIREGLQGAAPETLMEIIVAEAMHNKLFRNRLIASISRQKGTDSRQMYAEQIKTIIFEASRKGYIDWSASHQVGAGVSGLIDLAEKQIEKGNFTSAFNIITAIVEELTKALDYSDDSNGEIGGCIYNSIHIFYDLAETVKDEKLRMLMVDYCITSFRTGIFNGLDWHTDMLRVASCMANSSQEAEKIISLIEESKGSEFLISELQNIKYAILLKFDAEKADEYLRSNLANSDFRRTAISSAFESKDFNKAVLLAEDGIKYDADKPGLVFEWYNWLLRIAQAQKDLPKIIEYARYLFIDGYRSEQDYYKILKTNIKSEEWKPFVEELIADLRKSEWGRNESLILSVFVREEWWDRLMSAVRKMRYPEQIESYESYLSKDYSPELIELYLSSLNLCLDHCFNRNAYMRLCRFLQRVIKLGGEKQTLDFVTMVRQKYPRKRALMEELDKICRLTPDI